MAYDLCDTHADSFTVPQGWRLEDRRVPVPSDDPAPYDAPYGSALLS